MHRSAADSSSEVDLYARLVVFGKSEAKDAAVGRGGGFGEDVVIGQMGAVVACRSGFGGFVVMRAIAERGVVGLSRNSTQFAYSRHNEQVAQIAVPSDAAHLCESEALDGGVLVAVARPVVAAGDGVGADLRHAERSGRAGESFSKPVVGVGGSGVGAGADEGIDKIGGMLLAGIALRTRNQTNYS